MRSLTSDIQRVANARIYFGHHSVGDNMLNGVRRLAAEHGIANLRLVDIDSDPNMPEVCFAHSRIGTNRDPESKIDSFAQKMREELPVNPDIAFMKFCYVDFDPATEIVAIAGRYRAALGQLAYQFPSVAFVHATVPLTARGLSLKNRLKLVLGRTLWEDDANIKRHEFNQFLRREYHEDRIIDIACAESTKPDGSRQTFSRSGETYFSLCPRLTSDGGHLNETGERTVSTEMIRILARLLIRLDGPASDPRSGAG